MIDLCSPVKPDSGEKESSSGLGGTSIVITTHYIEEARQAHRVGMMRFGKLLEEGHPDDLMARYLFRSFSKRLIKRKFLFLLRNHGSIYFNYQICF